MGGEPVSLRDLLASAIVLQSDLRDAGLLAAAALMESVVRAIRNREPDEGDVTE
jgi:hypothetical protein